MPAPTLRVDAPLAKLKRLQELRAQLAQQDADRAQRYRADPVAWVQERLGEHVWSKQAEVLRAVAEHSLVSVRSGHGVGKSHLASRAAGWFLDTRPVGKTFVVTTAPTSAQVRAILWRYIRQMWSRHDLPGVVNQAAEWKIDGELVAYGRKPADYSETAFQGIHAEHLLVIVDEGSGVPKQLFVAADSLATGADSHILVIGNPDSVGSHWHYIDTTETGWHRVHISGYDSPNCTGETVPADLRATLVGPDWIEDKRRRWGAESSLFQAKVLGDWADDEDGLIPLSWVTAAHARWHDWNDSPTRDSEQPHGRTVFGVDVGHLGEDRTVIATRKGDVVMSLESWSKMDTVAVTGLVEARLRGSVQGLAVVDAIGVGAGVVDLLRAHRCNVRPFVASAATKRREATGTQRFPNVRSASWWNLRELLDPALGATLALPPDDDLTADLTTPRWEARTGGTIYVESKDEVRKRLGRSTDYGDAVAIAMWADPYQQDRPGAGEPLRPVAYADAGAWRDY